MANTNSTQIPQEKLVPEKCGVASADVDWLARGSFADNQGTRVKNAKASGANGDAAKVSNPANNSKVQTPTNGVSGSSNATKTAEGEHKLHLKHAAHIGKTLEEEIAETVHDLDAMTPMKRWASSTVGNSKDQHGGAPLSRVRSSSVGMTSQPKRGWLHSLSSKFGGGHQEQSKPRPKAEPPAKTQPKPIPVTPKSAPRSPRNSIPEDTILSTSPKVPPASPGANTGDEQRGLFGRLRRIRGASVSSPSTDQVTSRVILNKNTQRKDLPGPFKASVPRFVHFAPQVFDIDPPQQIPSRHPKQGNIIFGPEGEIQQRVVPEHYSSLSSLGQYPSNKSYAAISDSALAAAHESAQRMANYMKLQSTLTGGVRGKIIPSIASGEFGIHDDFDDDESERSNSANLQIDTPMHNRETIETHPEEGSDSESDGEGHHITKPPTPVDIYTRCCHLREILPIPATVKQLLDKSPPLSILRLMNPRPTLIEILSFSDFLSVMPTIMVVLDGTSLSTEMIKLIFSALADRNSIVKLSMRNVILDEVAWKTFCGFLIACKTLQKLDLSMQAVPTRPAKSDKASKAEKETKTETDGKATEATEKDEKNAKRADAKPKDVLPKKFPDRSGLDWNLFTEALEIRGGIEELLVNGCMIPSNQFEGFIVKGCALKTKRLGVASNDLHAADLQVIAKWINSPGCICQGIDLGGNDLSGGNAEVFRDLSLAPDLHQVSLNATNLSDVDQIYRLTSRMAELSHVRFVDFSGNPKLFPKFSRQLAELLPTFRDLRRIHLDNNDLSPEDIVGFAESFSRCPVLVHVSIVGNRRLNNTALAAMTMAVRLSSTIYVIEYDTDLVSPVLVHRMAHSCMMNIESIFKGDPKGSRIVAGTDDDDQTIDVEAIERDLDREFDNESHPLSDDHDDWVQAGNELAVAVDDILKSQENSEELKCSMIASAMAERARTMRASVQKYIHQLIEANSGETDEASKSDRIIRLLFLDANLEKVLKKYDSREQNNDSLNSVHPADTLLFTRDSKHLSPAANPAHPDLQIAPMDERPIALERTGSATSIASKLQELEEGEFHKLGTYMRKYMSDEDGPVPLNTVDDMEAHDRKTSISGADLKNSILKANYNDPNVSQLMERIRKLSKDDLYRVLYNAKDDKCEIPQMNEKEVQQLADRLAEQLQQDEGISGK